MGADRSHLGYCLPVPNPRCGMSPRAKGGESGKRKGRLGRMVQEVGHDLEALTSSRGATSPSIFFFLPRAPCSLGVSEDPSRLFLVAALADRWAWASLVFPRQSSSLSLSLHRPSPRRPLLVPFVPGPTQLLRCHLFGTKFVRCYSCERRRMRVCP